MFCTQCGAEISEDAVYCCKCGTKIIKDKARGGLKKFAEFVVQETVVLKETVSPDETETTECTPSDNAMEQKEGCDNGKGNTLGKDFLKLPVPLRLLAIAGGCSIIAFCVFLLPQLIQMIFSSLISMIIVGAGGYILYHKVIAGVITEYFYKKKSKELLLPEGMSASMLLEALSGKFNYPYFKGVHYGTEGECIIEGKYSIYPVVFSKENIAEIDYISRRDDKKKRTVLLETIAIRDYINKFFNPNLPIDVIKDMKRLRLAEGQRKAVAIVCAIASVLIAAVIVWDYFSPGSLQSMAVPGIEVRSAYLSQYSTKVTIEEAFESYFDNSKWTKYDSKGYTYVAFTGTCKYLGERADVRIIFKITGENFIVDSLDINGRTQSDFILYGLLSAIYEEY